MIKYIIEFFNIKNIKFKQITFKYDNQSFDCLLIGDKIVFVMEFENDEDIHAYVSKIPALRQQIQGKIDDIDTSNMFLQNNSLAGFLWDIYIVAICNDENKIDNLIINKLENDTFVAKKVIIKYKNKNDLISKFISNILPDKKLNVLITNEIKNNTINRTFIFEDKDNNNLLKYISKQQEKIDLQIINEYLDKLVKGDKVE